MKNILKITALFVLLFTNLFAQVAIDSTTAGRAFARNLWDRYQFHGDFDVDNNGVQKNFSGTMDLRGRIISLEVDGTVIVSLGDTPLPGLPYVTTGTMTNFWMGIDAMNKDDQVAWGYSQVQRLPEGKSLTVVLYPEDEQGFVNYDSKEDHPLLVDDEGNQVGYYNTDFDGFFYYLDPLDGPITAFVVENGRRITSIWLDPFSTASSLDNNLVNVELAGGVSRVLLNQYGYTSVQSTTDGQTTFDQINMPAKVFILDTESQAHSITIRLEKGQTVIAHMHDVDGNQFELIDQIPFHYAGYDGVYYGEYQIPQGYGKVLITVISTTTKQEPFRIFFSKGYGGKG